jgi:hypothetical protein
VFFVPTPAGVWGLVGGWGAGGIAPGPRLITLRVKPVFLER